MQVELIKSLLSQRDRARATKDYKLADSLKAELTSLGVTVMDTPNGSSWEFTTEFERKLKQRKDDREVDAFVLSMKRRGEGFARRGMEKKHKDVFIEVPCINVEINTKSPK